MHLTKSGIIVFLALLLSAPGFASAQSVPQLAQKALAATVSLEVQDENGDTLGRGSGFFVRPNLIATNFHVIDGAAKGYVRLVNTATSYSIESVTATDKSYDLALLKVTVNGVTPLPLGDSDAVQIGETVYAAGNPQGLEGTFSDGIISGRRDRCTKQERLQMTAPISPGSSGGAVLNRKGEVIGVATSLYNPLIGQNLNFAVPSNALAVLLRQPQNSRPLSSEKQSNSVETYRMRAQVSIRLGNYERAIREVNQALRLKPNDARSYLLRGFSKAKLGRYDSAIADYDRSIFLNPNDAKAYVNRGIAKHKLRQYFAAVFDFDEAIRQDPNDAKAYVNRGRAKVGLERYFAAILDFDEAIRQDPNDAKAYVNRGIAKYKLRQYFAAVFDFDEAIRQEPNDAIAYVNRGRAKVELERYFAAILDFDEAIRLDPNDARFYLARGLTRHLLRYRKMAKEDYRTALRLATLADNQDLKAEIEKALRLLHQ